MNKSIATLSLFAALGAIASSAMASDTRSAGKLSSAEIDLMVKTPQQGLAMTTAPTGADGPKVVVLRRTKSGEPEVHENFDDVFVVRSGRASVLVGGTIAGNRMVSTGEWRGGTITGAKVYEVATGDMLWIPAGFPHQVTFPAGKPGQLTYLAFKSPKPAAH